MALTAHVVLALVTIVMTLSWAVSKYNSWMDALSLRCVQRIIPSCPSPDDNFDKFYKCALLSAITSTDKQSTELDPLLAAYGQMEEASVATCGALLKLVGGFVTVDSRFMILHETASEDHGTIAIFGLLISLGILIFEKWINWVFKDDK